jgi:Zn-dependent protease with chaperone function
MMTLGYLERLVIQALSAHLVASAVAALAICATWRHVAASASPAVTARRIFLMRLIPSLLGGLAALLVALAYTLWETRVEVERVGVLGLTLASAGLVLVGTALWRTLVVTSRTWRVWRTLVRASGTRLPAVPLRAYIVESRFPVVALFGLVMARLFVARRVIDACTTDEFDAVIAHEQAHVRQRDNLRRMAMIAAPDPLGLLPAGRQMQQAWFHASELAADEWAAGRTSGVLLASALVKVARLATTSPEPLPASALYNGEPITERVHRLLELVPTDAPPRWPQWLRATACIAVVAAALIALPAVHVVAERILQWGP